MENKNTIIAMVLMLLVWAGFSVFFPSAPPPAVAPVTAPSPPASALSSPTVVPVVALSPQAQPPLVAERTAREVTVDTPNYRAVFTNSGARLKRFELKHYRTENNSAAPYVQVLDTTSNAVASLRLNGLEGLALNSEDLYSFTEGLDLLKLGPGESRELVFRTTTVTGVLVEKIYRFHGDRYDFDLDLHLVNLSDKAQSGKLLLTLSHPWDEKNAGGSYEFVGPVTLSGEKVKTDDVDDIVKEAEIYGKDTVWSGFKNKYFFSSLIPLDGATEKLVVQKKQDSVENQFETPILTLQPGAESRSRFLAYFGPLDMDILKATGQQLDKAIDFGFFSFLGSPLFIVLKYFNTFLHNFGWSIIVLTVVIKIIFWPLTQKSYSSMKSMQKLQPEMTKLREKFKNDRDRMNREIMELYKTHRVNPVGGCLPMVIQIPVFFALYQVLMNSIELRHAPFMFWITDLSAKDPYYITPLVMGATMFIQQKLTPTPSIDPIQAKIFMFLPVVFTVMFLNFPSGLVIYWLVNNLLTIAQQLHVNRKA